MNPNGRVASKVALVTGAASGIGKATALLLAKEGATVVVADIAAEAGQPVVEEISRSGARAVFQALDVTQETAWQDVTDRILHDFARLDIAVNNAGVAVGQQTLSPRWLTSLAVRGPVGNGVPADLHAIATRLTTSAARQSDRDDARPTMQVGADNDDRYCGR